MLTVMTDQGKRKTGTFIGVVLAAGLLPGITVGDTVSDVVISVALVDVVFTILTNVILIAPSSARPVAPARVLLGLAVFGVIQDTLLWLLASWLIGQLGTGLHVDGIGAAFLGGVIVRASIWAALFLLPGRTQREQPVTE